jgi:hypothetical protein
MRVEQLAFAVTKDPAMLLWLNGTSNTRRDVCSLRVTSGQACAPR